MAESAGDGDRVIELVKSCNQRIRLCEQLPELPRGQWLHSPTTVKLMLLENLKYVFTIERRPRKHSALSNALVNLNSAYDFPASRDRSTPWTFCALPDDVLYRVLQALPSREWMKIRLTFRSFNRVVSRGIDDFIYCSSTATPQPLGTNDKAKFIVDLFDGGTVSPLGMVRFVRRKLIVISADQNHSAQSDAIMQLLSHAIASKLHLVQEILSEALYQHKCSLSTSPAGARYVAINFDTKTLPRPLLLASRRERRRITPQLALKAILQVAAVSVVQTAIAFPHGPMQDTAALQQLKTLGVSALANGCIALVLWLAESFDLEWLWRSLTPAHLYQIPNLFGALAELQYRQEKPRSVLAVWSTLVLAGVYLACVTLSVSWSIVSASEVRSNHIVAGFFDTALVIFVYILGNRRPFSGLLALPMYMFLIGLLYRLVIWLGQGLS